MAGLSSTGRRSRPGRYWVIGGLALVLAVILGANGHMLYVAVSSQPGCAEVTVAAAKSGC